MILPHEKQIYEYENTLKKLKEQNQKSCLWSQEEIDKLEKKLELLKKKVYSSLTSWDRVSICRHPLRPHTDDYIKNLCEQFEEISGDRIYRNDNAIIAGLGKIEGKKFVLIGLEKGKDTESRLYRNFGMAHPEGYRKALRAMQLAEKFRLPVITFLDTPGAYPGLSAEERGQGWAIAKNLLEMAKLATPIIVVIIGEGCSGGALGIGVGDRIGMLQHAYYSVISPEGCSSILWKDASKNEEASCALKMHAEDLYKFGIVDVIIEEPQGGAHNSSQEVFSTVKQFILESRRLLKNIPVSDLIEQRYQKFRQIGEFNISEK